MHHVVNSYTGDANIFIIKWIGFMWHLLFTLLGTLVYLYSSSVGQTKEIINSYHHSLKPWWPEKQLNMHKTTSPWGGRGSTAEKNTLCSTPASQSETIMGTDSQTSNYCVNSRDGVCGNLSRPAHLAPSVMAQLKSQWSLMLGVKISKSSWSVYVSKFMHCATDTLLVV